MSRHAERAVRWLALACLAAAGSACSGETSPPPSDAAPQNPVVWSIALAPGASLKAGGQFNAQVTAQIATGWHMYAMSQVAGGPFALTMTMPARPPFSIAGPIVEPAPKTAHDPNFDLDTRFFEDSATFAVPIGIAKNAPARAETVSLEVTFQACNARSCLPQTKAPLTLDVTIAAGAPGTTPR